MHHGVGRSSGVISQYCTGVDVGLLGPQRSGRHEVGQVFGELQAVLPARSMIAVWLMMPLARLVPKTPVGLTVVTP